MRKKILFSCFFIMVSIMTVFSQTEKNRKLILKLNSTYKAQINESDLNTFIKSFIPEGNIKRIYPNHKSPEKNTDQLGHKLIDLTLYYEMSYNSPFYPENKVILTMMSSGLFEYVEPEVYPQLFYTPDDANIAGQYYLNNIQAYAAWDLCKGDSTIIIGITDTGYDFGNADLTNQVARNSDDPIDGLDNDFDGYIDNRDGWDFGDNDNNPQWNELNSVINDHGVAVSGAASAETDNGVLIAGIGFKTKLLPVKIMDQYGILSGSYEGLVYAADQGCDVINCSWGSTIKSKYGQDMVNYATYNCNSLVIAAAGNSDQFEIFYPASYDNVISVAGTNSNDHKWTSTGDLTPDGSSFGPYVDVCAPAVGILVITAGGLYWSGRGTSIACPIVAGEAAIIKAHYDTLSALQIGEVLRITSDNIDTISFNTPFAGYLGNGRINMYRALTDTLTPSVRFNNIRFNGVKQSDFIANDTINITGIFTNYLMPTTSSCTAILTTNSPYVQILQNTVSVGDLGELDTVSNNTQPFVIKILPGIDYNEQIIFKITYTDQNYSAFEYFDLLLNHSYYYIDTNKLGLTVTANGRFCYAEYYPEAGEGCYYNDMYELMSYAGIMTGVNKDSIADFFSEPSDFVPLSKIISETEKMGADVAVQCSFNDSQGGTNKPNLEIKQTCYAWTQPSLENCIILKYRIINKNSHHLDSMYFGLYLDVDMKNLLMNTFEYDPTLRLAYANSNDGTNLYTAIKLLSPLSSNFYAFDFVDGGFGGIDVTDDFTDEEKYQCMSTSRYTAGFDSINDIAGILSAGPFNISSGDTIEIYFSLMADIHYQNILDDANASQELYDSLFSNISNPVKQITENILYPNPSTEQVNIKFYSDKQEVSTMRITNTNGKLVFEKPQAVIHGQNTINLNIEHLNKGIYFITLGRNYWKLIVSD